MTMLWQDVLYGLRMLAKKPGFTAIAVLSLGLGIGANTAIFSLVNAILLGSLSFHEPGRLVMIGTTPPGHPEQTDGAMIPDFIAWKERSRSFENLGALSGGGLDLGASENGSPAQRIQGEQFSPAVFRILGVRPILGRTFTDDEDQIDTPAPVILISHRLWKQRFASDPNIVNKTLRADHATFTIIGVMPPDFRFRNDAAEFWMPLAISRFQLQGSGPYLGVVARLKPGVSIPRAQAEMENIANQLARDFPTRNKGRGVRVEPIRDALFGWMRQPLWMLQGAVAFVLLIACANVAGLLLSRASSRQTEVAVRAALGASRSRIVRQLLTESILLSIFGGALGALLAWVGIRMLIVISPPWFPRLHEISVDTRVLAFTALLSIATGFTFGVIPALQMSKSNLAESLKESARSSAVGLARQRFRGALTAGQIALALVLLVGAGLMINSFLRLQGADLGCDPSGLVTFRLILPGDDYVKSIGSYHNYPLVDVSPVPALTFDRLYERILAVPGVQSAAGSVYLPLTEGESMNFTLDGRPKPANDAEKNALSAMFFPVTANLFATLKAPLLRGRDFTARDTASAPWVTVINQTMARMFWPNENPMGKHITLDLVPEERPREVIGVVRDIKVDRYQTKPQPAMYAPQAQMPQRYRGPYQWTRVVMSFVVRPSADRKSVIPALRRVVTEMDPSLPIGDFRSMEEVLGEQVQESRYYTMLLGIFAAVATGLAMVGIYGVMAYSVAQRTREIGIRMALGARRGDVLKLVLRHSLSLIGLGLVVGLAGSFALTRFIASQLWGISATDPATFVIVSLLLILVALMATLVPTRRAVQVDPTVALRYE
jgi:putative ABC transport system permease protein